MQEASNARVDTRTAAMLTETPYRTVQLTVNDGRMPAEIVPITRGGKGGLSYSIAVRDLPVSAQLAWKALNEEKHDLSANLAGYKAKNGEEGLKKLMDIYDAVRELALYKEQKRRDLVEQRARIAGELKLSTSRLYQLEAAYKKDGLSGLMGPMTRADKGAPRTMCLLAQDYATAEYCVGSKVTQSVVYENLKKLAAAMGEKACEICPYNPASLYRATAISRGLFSDGELPVCEHVMAVEAKIKTDLDAGTECDAYYYPGMVAPQNRCAFNRFIATLPPGAVALGRMGVRYWEARFMPKCLRAKPEMVNEVWFGDHHVFDCFVLYEGKPVRPWLTAWMDARSGAIVGWALSLNPNSNTIIKSLANAIRYTVGSPFHGLPVMLYIDNGKDYRCKRIEGDGLRDYDVGQLNVSCTADNALLKSLGIGVTHAIPYRAWSKTIERMFGTIEPRWCRQIPGWCGNGIDQKPEDLSADIRAGRLWTFEQFVAYFANVILPEYHAYIPDGDKERQSPMDIYLSSPRARDKEEPSGALLAVYQMRSIERKVTTQGVNFFGRKLANYLLGPYIGQYVQIKYDGEADQTVTIYDRDNTYICEATDANEFALIGEDEERLAEHMERQQLAKREARAALRLPTERVKLLGSLATEIPDLSMTSTITSLAAEQAYRGREEKRAEITRIHAERTAAEKSAENRISAELKKRGAELHRQAGAG